VDEDYPEYRMRSTRYLGNALTDIGVSIVQPVGRHAVYVNAKELIPTSARSNTPGSHSLWPCTRRAAPGASRSGPSCLAASQRERGAGQDGTRPARRSPARLQPKATSTT
jgi:tryptophanase